MGTLGSFASARVSMASSVRDAAANANFLNRFGMDIDVISCTLGLGDFQNSFWLYVTLPPAAVLVPLTFFLVFAALMTACRIRSRDGGYTIACSKRCGARVKMYDDKYDSVRVPPTGSDRQLLGAQDYVCSVRCGTKVLGIPSAVTVMPMSFMDAIKAASTAALALLFVVLEPAIAMAFNASTCADISEGGYLLSHPEESCHAEAHMVLMRVGYILAYIYLALPVLLGVWLSTKEATIQGKKGMRAQRKLLKYCVGGGGAS